MKNSKKLIFKLSLISQALTYIGALIMLCKKEKGAAKLLTVIGVITTVLTFTALDKEKASEKTKKTELLPEKTKSASETSGNDNITVVINEKNENASSESIEASQADENQRIDRAIEILKSTVEDEELCENDDFSAELEKTLSESGSENSDFSEEINELAKEIGQTQKI